MLARLEEHDALIVQLKSEIDILKAKVATLELRLGKNLPNSSKPPSTDAFVKPRPGPCADPPDGHRANNPGMRLEPTENPDQVIPHEPDACEEYGLDLSTAPVSGERFRQVFDLPPVRLQVLEQWVGTRTCSGGHRTEARFPPEASPTTCYGPKLQGLGAYLLHRHHLPVARTAKLMADAYGAPVSTS